ncbi:MAG: LPS-assembly protein LptD [Pseudomonadota bacterium]
MLLAWLGQGGRNVGGMLLAIACGWAVAAESLEPLRVDPTLLGGAPREPQPAAAPPAEVRPVEVRPAVVTPTVAQALPVKVEQDKEATVSEATVPRQVRAPAITAQNLPPLRVDPALLGGASLLASSPRPLAQSAGQSVAVAGQQTAQAPQAEHPAVRIFPHPATTPFSATDKKAAPTNVWARKINGLNDVEMVAEGDALIERAGDTLSADRIVYRQLDDEVEATGNVRLTSPDTAISGPRLRMRMEEGTGEFESPAYSIKHKPAPIQEAALTILGLPAITEGGRVLATTGRKLERPEVTGSGVADRLEFRGEDQYHLSNATYSTCAPGKRDWEIFIDALDLDYTSETGTGRSAVVSFMDAPIFYLPWLSFSLNNQRKSGFLPPTIGSTSKSGFEFAAPWYWNIAPHMDATITPRVMTRRGLQLSTEFRYLLDSTYNRNHALPGTPLPDKGQIRIEYLPDDKLANKDRYGYSIVHTQNLGYGLTGSLNLNGVSDDDYFSDLSTRVAQVSQGNLLRQGTLTYGGSWYSATLNLQTYQTLQDLQKPFQRLPQITASAFRYDLPLGLTFNLNAEYVSFDHPTYLLGKRTTLYPQLSLPLATAAFALTPKIGIHSTQYSLSRLDQPGPGQIDLQPGSNESRVLPIFSVDGGFVMERATDWFGQALTQTLEPRAYYAYIPRRDQRRIPVFDSGLSAFNYAQMFSENRYAGGDRIGDANELTLAVTSRLLDSASGADLLRATLGTRYYFTDQYVTLPGETARTERSADILATLAGQVLPHTYADIGWQYNPRDARTERLTLGGRYRPEAGKVMNAGYRYDRSTDLKQIDVSAQWPLFGGWHGVGRYNYSINERRVIETIGGLEYDAGCWVGRFVVQRLATIADQPTTSIFFQLELNDFSRIGSNPMQLLRRSIPGYGVINQPTADPVFAEN